MKKYINIALIAIAFVGITGCSSSSKTFDNDFISFKYPESFNMTEVDYGYVFLNGAEGEEQIQLHFTGKLDVSLEEIIISHSEIKIDSPEVGIEKIEDLIIDGKDAKHVTIKGPNEHWSFMFIEYEEKNFTLFQFFSFENEDDDQIMQDIIDSIKFK